MKRYKGTAVFHYYQVIEVDAESQDKAEEMMSDLMDVNKAQADDCEIFDVHEVKGKGSMTAHDLIESLRQLPPQTEMFVWIDGNRECINGVDNTLIDDGYADLNAGEQK